MKGKPKKSYGHSILVLSYRLDTGILKILFQIVLCKSQLSADFVEANLPPLNESVNRRFGNR